MLNETPFTSLAHAREKIATYVRGYNTGRPHSSLGDTTPAAFAADLKSKRLRRLPTWATTMPRLYSQLDESWRHVTCPCLCSAGPVPS